MISVAEAAGQYSPSSCYLNTATVGLPPMVALDALAADTSRWQYGEINALSYDEDIHRARTAFAGLVGAPVGSIAIMSQVSQVSGLVAASLSVGDEVLLAEGDFTSVMFPFLQATQRGVRVRTVPLEELVDAIEPSTRLVAVSAAQSADGRVLDLDALAEAAANSEVMTYVDITQAASWLAIDADRFSVTACGAYKWLSCPRGAVFATVRGDVFEQLPPIAAGWYAGEQPWDSIYGEPLRLAADARRYDVSPAWSAWVAAVPSLELLADVGVDAIGAHDVALANRFREGIDLASSNSAIVSFAVPGAEACLRQAGVVFAGRAGRTRLSFHLYNTVDDVDLAVRAVPGRHIL